MLKRLVEKGRSKSNRISTGQKQLPFEFDYRFNQIPEEWHHIAARFRRDNGIRDGGSEKSNRQLRWGCIRNHRTQECRIFVLLQAEILQTYLGVARSSISAAEVLDGSKHWMGFSVTREYT